LAPRRASNRVLPIALVAVVVLGVGAWFVVPTVNRFEPAPWSAVVKVELVPIPEGSPAPPFESEPNSEVSYELADLAPLAPAELPAPLDQHGCDIGGDMIITLLDGRTVTYGPCRRPASIERLWAGIESLLQGGDLIPRYGPGASPSS
jgi:hypothetical protein